MKTKKLLKQLEKESPVELDEQEIKQGLELEKCLEYLLNKKFIQLGHESAFLKHPTKDIFIELADDTIYINDIEIECSLALLKETLSGNSNIIKTKRKPLDVNVWQITQQNYDLGVPDLFKNDDIKFILDGDINILYVELHKDVYDNDTLFIGKLGDWLVYNPEIGFSICKNCNIRKEYV